MIFFPNLPFVGMDVSALREPCIYPTAVSCQRFVMMLRHREADALHLACEDMEPYNCQNVDEFNCMLHKACTLHYQHE